MANLRPIWSSEPFTFIVGTTREEFKIHPGLLAPVSQPLNALATGSMRESQERSAILDDVEEETFALFVEYLYTKSYCIPEQSPPSKKPVNSKEKTVSDPTFGKLTKFRCSYCSVERSLSDEKEREAFPNCAGHSVRLGYRHCVACGKFMSHTSMEVYWCDTCQPKQMFQLRDKQAGTYYRFRLFTERRYPAAGAKHDQLRKHISALDPPESTTSGFLSHAKLFALANRYCAEELEELCLHKLHRVLSLCKLSAENIAEIMDVIRLTCSESFSLDNARRYALRDLVMTYAACKSEELATFDEFLEMLEDGGPPASQFVVFVNKRFT